MTDAPNYPVYMYPSDSATLSIVMAYLTANPGFPLHNIPKLIATVRDGWGRSPDNAQPAPVAPESRRVAAVPIEESVTDEYVVCLEDGKHFKSLKRHLHTHHNLSPEEYRARWGLPDDYPVVAPAYSAIRSELARESGLGTR